MPARKVLSSTTSTNSQPGSSSEIRPVKDDNKAPYVWIAVGTVVFAILVLIIFSVLCLKKRKMKKKTEEYVKERTGKTRVLSLQICFFLFFYLVQH